MSQPPGGVVPPTSARVDRFYLADLLAGLSIAGLLLPEAVAYSSIAALPPQAGIIGLLAGLICYALIGRSRFAIVSATSSSAAVLAAGVTALLGGSAAVSRPLVMAMLVLLTGICFLVASVARLGGISHFIARPVLRGYAFGLACVIAVKQLPGLLGLPGESGDFIPGLLAGLWRQLPSSNLASGIMGACALTILFVCERIPRLPGSLLVIVLGILVAPWLAAHGVALTGNINLSLQWAWPVWPDRAQWLPSIELAAALLLILYAESYGSIRTFALKHGEEVRPTRDLAALGAANVLSGLFQGMPVGAGYSGTSANEAAGARTRWAGLVAAGAVLLMLGLFMRWVEHIPKPVLAAIVIHAVSRSWRLSVFVPYFKWHRDRLVALAAVLSVITLGILDGLLVAIALSLVALLRQLARPRLSVLGRVAGTHDFLSQTQHPQVQPVSGMLILRPEEPLFFVNAETILAAARQHVSDYPADVHRVVLSLEVSPNLDSTSVEALSDFADWLSHRGTELRVARLKDPVRELLLRAALPWFPPETLSFWSVEDAVSDTVPGR
ncbi:MAG: SulP family inorganic anion transporter [Xanthomonadaceae bacterium]|jgi:MFS superfamily sulfate permease-like transporter|nr:SulP family inorganic anion transporter [Xanthomonadaceae bacterium]